ncbi:cell wall-active antibiotics response protein LiaF [Tuberibacillus sp. Marseille-P3662]|uniref:cell wall-active antibiotics response protein LiaF n=1 Tax=Tuberibacillus sp. Marseille-P3662 TaxID=1965358 RepID=UPI000A1CDD48|nr:cell wall-active antibiotics response protein LiaF [Tuberibacillus sp. Marseille-P3662]
MRRSGNQYIGIIIIIIGTIIFLNVVGIGGMLVGPAFLVLIGVLSYHYGHRYIAYTFFILGIIAFANHFLNIDIGGLVVACLFIYFGYRLLSGKSKGKRTDKKYKKAKHSNSATEMKEDDDDWIDKEIEQLKKERRRAEERAQKTKKTVGYDHVTVTTPKIRSALIGDLRLMNQRFELDDMNIWHGVGDVKIDLTKAIISEGETVIMINGWVGDIDVYIPYDLDVAVNASVTIGDLEVMGHNQGGINRHLSLQTKDYPTSTRQVKLILSLFIGDIDVRYL